VKKGYYVRVIRHSVHHYDIGEIVECITAPVLNKSACFVNSKGLIQFLHKNDYRVTSQERV